MKKIGDSNTDNKDIHSGYRNGIWQRKCTIVIIECGKRHITEGIELPNHKR